MKKIISILGLLFLLTMPISAADADAGTEAEATEAEGCSIEEEVITPCSLGTDDFYDLDEEYFTAPIIGEFNAKTVSLPILAMVVGAVDGFNPCAMWILIFLITILFNVPDKKKRWILGLAFILTSGILYLFFMVAWLNLAIFLTKIIWIRLLIAIFAIIFGMVNIYRFMAERNKTVGCDVTTEKQRSKIMERVKKAINQKQFIFAVFGIIAVSASVNIFELLCSLGLPLMFTQVLALNNLSGFQYGFYIGLYILFFMLNELIIFTVAMTTMSIKGISNKFTKYSHLVGGTIMLILGLLMALKPEWLMLSF